MVRQSPDDPQIVGAAGFQGTGSRIGGIAQGRCRLLNAQGSFRADVGRSIKRFADCRNRNAAFPLLILIIGIMIYTT